MGDSPPEHFICPISRQIMCDPVMLSDGTHYDVRSIVPWLLRTPISPLTTLKVSYRLERSHALVAEIRNSAFRPEPSRLETSIEEEETFAWYKREEMGEVEWREYLVLRRLYWLLKFQECGIPDCDRVYVEYNNPKDGLGRIRTQHPSSFCTFGAECPNRFTTLWVVLRRDNIRGILQYLYNVSNAVLEYCVEHGLDDRKTLVYLRIMGICQRCRKHIRRYSQQFLEHPLWPLLPLLFIVLCVFYAVFMYIHTHSWVVSLLGYPFWTAACLHLLFCYFGGRVGR